ncbi:MAG: hypothetical protein FRX49_04991 [Trebouxia sp. A1-2]|nr:MAG: hypothetical protein FRX49_04991 [Trebouxia sp. A1-2]
MLVEADELCAVSTLLTQNRAAQERPEALLRKGVTDIRTASAPNSIKVRKQKNKSWKLQDNQLQHCPWNCGLIGGGIEMVGLDVTGSPSVFNKYRSPGALKVVKADT